MHGTTMHGLQSQRPALKLQPVAYYGHLRDVFSTLHDDARHLPMAVIGLGAGTVACHGRKGQRVDFYEIDPAVVEIAQTPQYFSYLRDCPAESHVILGDGRLEIARAEDKRYGLLVIDAFSSDALPMHLLTREAFALYRSKLAPHGILLVNISNRHLNLAPVMAAIAEDSGWLAFLRRNMQPEGPLAMPSIWVVMASGTGDFKEDTWPRESWELMKADPGMPLWTDNYSNILQTLF
jgi:spermidine synthase